MPSKLHSYVAFIRGVGPGDPRMSHKSFTKFFTSLGMKDVVVIQMSGNVVFSSSIADKRKLEQKIEAAMPKKLGFSRSTIVRSLADLQAIVKADPFRGIEHGKKFHCNLVFVKDLTKLPTRYTYVSPDKSFRLKVTKGGAVASIHSFTDTHTIDLMKFTEKTFGKDSTMRTWNTVQRILGKMAEQKFL